MNHERLTFIEQDIRQQNWNLDELVMSSDLVIDLIAYANPGYYVKMPLEVFRLNFMDNLKIAESCVRHDKRLIQFSSCEVYGETLSSFANETIKDPEDPDFATFSEDTSEFILGPVCKHRRIPDISKARRLLGWEPKWGLSDMLEITMRYYVSEYIKQIPTVIKSETLEQKTVYNALSRD